MIFRPWSTSERVGAIDVAEGLVGQEPLGGQERPALAEQMVQLLAGDPHRRQRAHVGAVVERQPQRAGAQLGGAGRRMHLVEDHRQALPLAGRLALDVDEVRGVRHRLEHDDELRRQLQRHRGLFAGRQLDGIERDLLDQLVEAGLGQIDPGAPEDLPEVFHDRQQVRIVRRDAAHPRAHRERDLDHLVEGRLIAAGAQRAIVAVLAHRLERLRGVEHAAAAGHSTFQESSNRPSRAACRKAPITFSSSRPRSAAKTSALTRHSARSVPSPTSVSIAATTCGSADARSVSNSALVSLMAGNLCRIHPAARGRPINR